MEASYTCLALGDSYTIGEMVPLYESFPYQAVQLLRRDGRRFAAPEIVAQTGWTTGELQAAMKQTEFLESYDLVSLLIGVNNQYRGRDLQEYAAQFEELLQQSISLAGRRPEQVVVLSIPDWSITPFARGREIEKISREIDTFNTCNRTIALRYKTRYIDITTGSRDAAKDVSLLAADGLHPSAREYARWAAALRSAVKRN